MLPLPLLTTMPGLCGARGGTLTFVQAQPSRCHPEPQLQSALCTFEKGPRYIAQVGLELMIPILASQTLQLQGIRHLTHQDLFL